MPRTQTSDRFEPGTSDAFIVPTPPLCDNIRLSPDCYKYEGSGDDIITPVYTPPINNWETTTEKWPEMCGDDEDCGDGSGDDGPGDGASIIVSTSTARTCKFNWLSLAVVSYLCGQPTLLTYDCVQCLSANSHCFFLVSCVSISLGESLAWPRLLTTTT